MPFLPILAAAVPGEGAGTFCCGILREQIVPDTIDASNNKGLLLVHTTSALPHVVLILGPELNTQDPPSLQDKLVLWQRRSRWSPKASVQKKHHTSLPLIFRWPRPMWGEEV